MATDTNNTIVMNSAVWDRMEGTYECRILLCPEEVGGYSVHCLNLPGVFSEGETEQECIENAAEAFRAALREYRESNMAIPWGDEVIDDAPRGSKELWLLVNV